MAKAAVQFSKDNEYYTPKGFVSRFFANIDYDPATTKEKANEFGILNFDTIESDGLRSDWSRYKNIWINPPFTHKHLFLNKAVSTFRKSGNNICILFPIGFLTTKRFQESGAIGTLYIPNGRIRFESGLGKNSSAPAFGSVVLRLGQENTIRYFSISGESSDELLYT